MELRGPVEELYWFGIEGDIFYQIFKQQKNKSFGLTTINYTGDLSVTGLLLSINIYPMAIFTRNYRLKASFIYGIFEASKEKKIKPDFDNIMARIEYSF